MNMRRLINLIEAPIDNFQQIGNWENDPGDIKNYIPGRRPWANNDKKIINNPRLVKKITTAWSRTPFHFNQFIYQGPLAFSSITYGQVYPENLTKHIKDPDGIRMILDAVRPDVITIVHTNNLADQEPISLTPWMLAHRTAHAIDGNSHFKDDFDHIKEVFCQIIRLYERLFYGPKDVNTVEDLMVMFNDDSDQRQGASTKIISGVLTMTSARHARVTGSYEAMYECIAQFIINGKVTLQPFPEQFLGQTNLDPKRGVEVIKRLEKILNRRISDELTDCMGKIYIM